MCGFCMRYISCLCLCACMYVRLSFLLRLCLCACTCVPVALYLCYLLVQVRLPWPVFVGYFHTGRPFGAYLALFGAETGRIGDKSRGAANVSGNLTSWKFGAFLPVFWKMGTRGMNTGGKNGSLSRAAIVAELARRSGRGCSKEHCGPSVAVRLAA